nr:hypothetical protein [Tanacetum cinerariifolium]
MNVILNQGADAYKVSQRSPYEIAYLTGDVRFGKAFPTDTSLDAGQDRENIAKTYALPHEAPPRQHSLMEKRIQSQDLEITQLKTRVKTLEDNKKRREGFAQEDAPNTGEGVDQRDDLLDRDKSADKKSESTNEMSYVLGSLGDANILASGGLRLVFTIAGISVATASTYISPAVATASGSFSTTVIFITASVATPTSRVTRSSRGVVIGSSEQAKRDSEIARIHDEKELKMMIAELDRSNEMVVKHLSEYAQAAVGLSHD